MSNVCLAISLRVWKRVTGSVMLRRWRELTFSTPSPTLKRIFGPSSRKQSRIRSTDCRIEQLA